MSRVDSQCIHADCFSATYIRPSASKGSIAPRLHPSVEAGIDSVTETTARSWGRPHKSMDYAGILSAAHVAMTATTSRPSSERLPAPCSRNRGPAANIFYLAPPTSRSMSVRVVDVQCRGLQFLDQGPRAHWQRPTNSRSIRSEPSPLFVLRFGLDSIPPYRVIHSIMNESAFLR